MTREVGPLTEEDLCPHVAELIGKVQAKVAEAPTLTEIRVLAERALAEARHNSLTVAEIRQLADIATAKAREVEECAGRLADLLSGVAGG